VAVLGRFFGFLPEDLLWLFLFPCLGPFAKELRGASPFSISPWATTGYGTVGRPFVTGGPKPGAEATRIHIKYDA
jgi:hypothetical protein